MIVKRFHKARVSDSKEGESARSNQRQSENGYAALGRLDAMIIGLRYWERLESTMTGGSANRLMVSARRDAITVHAGLSVTLVCSSLSLTKLAMIAVIAPNCLMAGKWMIIVLERHEELPSRHEFFVIRLTDLCTLYARIERERNDQKARVPFARFAGIATGAWIQFYPVYLLHEFHCFNYYDCEAIKDYKKCWKQITQVYFFSKINIYNMVN